MLSAVSLKDLIKSKMEAVVIRTALNYQNAFADAINEYFNANLVLNGIYSGTMLNPSPPPTNIPDVLNGSYVWGSPTVSVSGSVILAAVSGITDPNQAMTAWKNSLRTQLSLTSFIGFNKTNLVSLLTSVKPSVGLISISFSNPTNRDQSLIDVATGIINALTSSVATPSFASTTSVSPGGSGTSTSFTFS